MGATTGNFASTTTVYTFPSGKIVKNVSNWGRKDTNDTDPLQQGVAGFRFYFTDGTYQDVGKYHLTGTTLYFENTANTHSEAVHEYPGVLNGRFIGFRCMFLKKNNGVISCLWCCNPYYDSNASAPPSPAYAFVTTISTFT